jgi:hypothetical protein
MLQSQEGVVLRRDIYIVDVEQDAAVGAVGDFIQEIVASNA